MSSGKKAQPLSEAKSLSRKEQLWLPGTPEKSSFQGSFYQPRTPQRHNVSIADGMIHTTVAQLDNVPLKSMSNWPISVLSRSLFLAHESMTLCGLGAGELCQVLVDGDERGIYWAWPQSSAEEKIEAAGGIQRVNLGELRSVLGAAAGIPEEEEEVTSPETEIPDPHPHPRGESRT